MPRHQKHTTHGITTPTPLYWDSVNRAVASRLLQTTSTHLHSSLSLSLLSFFFLSYFSKGKKMASLDRSKKRIQLWKKAALHFLFCFVMGFFTGFAPTNTASIFAGNTVSYQPIKNLGISAQPTKSLQKAVEPESLNRELMSATPTQIDPPDEELETSPRKLLIILTTTRSGNRLQDAFLTRLAHTLRLVAPPLLWVVVESRSAAPATAGVLRETGVMYRHLTYKKNFTDPDAEADHQRNVALNHIEYHRLNGIVHFAELSNIYDLQFFDEIRDIEVFGAWPVAMLSSDRDRVVVEGPICRSSKVVGWQWRDFSNHTTYKRTPLTDTDTDRGATGAIASKINISGFAFNSSILWDPERWGRPSSVPDTSQDSIKFVQQVVLEDEAKLRAIPSDCSRIMTWQLHIPRSASTQNYSSSR